MINLGVRICRLLDEGLEQGRMQRDLEIAKNLLDVLDDEMISLKTGLPVLTIRQLREELKC